MYLAHFSLNERPFSISPDPRFLFMSNRYREALAHLTYGVEDGGGFVLLTGEVGTGKTTVCRCLLQQLPDDTRLAFVLNPKLDSVELLATICDELDIPYPDGCTSLKTFTDELSQYLLRCYEKGLSVVVMIDEAQNIATEVLEQIRLLTNLETNQKKLLQIILVGQPELQEKLAKRELRQLAQRITARYHLRPLNLKETMAYILHRIRIAGGRKNLFSRKSIELLHRKTAGVPRLINTICDRALVASSSRKMLQVDHKIMQEAVNDVMGNVVEEDEMNRTFPTDWLKWVSIAVAVILLLSVTFWLGQRSSPVIVKAGEQSSTDHSSLSTGQIDGGAQFVVDPQKNTQINNSRFDTNRTGSKKTVSNSQSTLIQRMLGNERWDNNSYWSMQNLMSLWQIEYSPITDGDGCKFAAEYGLMCQQSNGNWQQLRNYDRPAMLKFSAGLQGEFWGTLSALSGVDATLLFGKRKVSVPLDELSMIWTGEFKLLWKVPNGYQTGLKLGDQGLAVVWLHEKMQRLVDPELTVTSVFGVPLKRALSEYQGQRNITSDGIAGMQTILTINRETLEGIPLLQKN
jgi:general secretion pathway protein A